MTTAKKVKVVRNQAWFFDDATEPGKLDLDEQVKKILVENDHTEMIYNQDVFSCLCEMTQDNLFFNSFLI